MRANDPISFRPIRFLQKATLTTADHLNTNWSTSSKHVDTHSAPGADYFRRGGGGGQFLLREKKSCPENHENGILPLKDKKIYSGPEN